MIIIKNLTIVTSLLSLVFFSYGQRTKSEQKFIEYFKQLKVSEVDSILILESGCTGCDFVYADSKKSVIDGKTIYVLTQKKGHIKLAIFDDINIPKYYLVDTCLLFDTINHYKQNLILKDTFYKKELEELKKSKFIPPRPIHYPFNEVTIQLPNFKYNFKVVGKDADFLGFIRENEKWFQATKIIIEKLFELSKSVKDW